MERLRTLIVGLSLVIINGCGSINSTIIQVGECEQGIVTKDNIADIQKIFPNAQITGVLISGGCYQERFIRKM